DCSDVVFRGFLIGGRRLAMVVYVDGMVEDSRLERFVISPLTKLSSKAQIPTDPAGLISWLESTAVTADQIAPVPNIGQVVSDVMSGSAVLFVDGVSQALSLGMPGLEYRAIDEPSTEVVIRGPREGFTESVRLNATLLRRRLRSPHLKMEEIELGRKSRTTVIVAYLKDVADPGLVAEVKGRIQRIDLDAVTGSSSLEELIEDQPSSLFPQIRDTERTDTAVACLAEGRVVIIVDGTPFVLVAPATFWSFLQAAEDYYQRFWMATALRWLHYVFYFVSLTMPSLYIATVTFHQELLPTPLLMTVAASREGVPFPALVEAFLMEIFFEALREAGARLPRPTGQAVSIVGALVVGQAAVQAGIVSAPKVMIVAATGIASFTIPTYSFGFASRLLRFPLMVLAGSLGLFGLVVGLLAILVHLCSLRSFGVPYLAPLAPFRWDELKDVLVRAPFWVQKTRPSSIRPINPYRGRHLQKPAPGGGGT
ncbi:MAG TPA: spore germination protein, partial [Symbiobacteriaceae bacterium]